jgi:hypothetical protein
MQVQVGSIFFFIIIIGGHGIILDGNGIATNKPVPLYQSILLRLSTL